MSVGSPWWTRVASDIGVPRRQRRTCKGYPELLTLSGPKSVETNTVSASIQLRLPLASGRSNPPSEAGTNRLATRSNSRVTSASEPPWDRAIRACRHGCPSSGRSTVAPCHTQSSCSAALRASTSISTSQSGSSVRYESSDVRRHSPRGCSASVQKLYSWSPRRTTFGMFAGESRIAFSSAAKAVTSLFASSSPSARVLRSRTHPSASSPVTSSSHSHGSVEPSRAGRPGFRDWSSLRGHEPSHGRSAAVPREGFSVNRRRPRRRPGPARPPGWRSARRADCPCRSGARARPRRNRRGSCVPRAEGPGAAHR